VQAELATRLASLMSALPAERAILFLEAFFITMQREWPGIDRLRMDKFMSLVRCFVAEAFTYCAKRQWPAELTRSLMRVYLQGPLDHHDVSLSSLYFMHLFLSCVLSCFVLCVESALTHSLMRV
jgi:ribosomal RNA-processing protein 1